MKNLNAQDWPEGIYLTFLVSVLVVFVNDVIFIV